VVFSSATSDSLTTTLGFKMMFVVLPESQEPQLVSEWNYNCSVPHYKAFKPLLACNFISECVGGEDEQQCSHESPECGPGLLKSGEKCLRFLPNLHGMTGFEAEFVCQ
jgi:hypothetical protein